MKDEWLWDPDVQKFIKQSIEGIDKSAIFLQLYNKDLADEPLPLMQLGYAIMKDKPIAVLVKKGEKVPAKLKAMADVIEEYDPEDRDSLASATKKILKIIEARP